MIGKRTYRKEFQFVGNGTIWRIYDAFGSLVEKGKAKSQKDARLAACTAERRLPQVNLKATAVTKTNKWNMDVFHYR